MKQLAYTRTYNLSETENEIHDNSKMKINLGQYV